MRKLRYTIIAFFIGLSFQLRAQSSFTLQSENVCLTESLILTNTSVGATSYEWDFCFESFSQAPAIIESNTPVSITGFTTGLELIFDGGVWYGFYGDRSNGNFFLLEYGNSLNNVPTASPISLTGDNWTNYKDIRLVNEMGVWYGLVTTYNNNKLYRLNFGSTIGTSATSEDLGNLSGWSEVRGMDLAKDGDDYVLAVSSASTNTITMVRFSGSITAAPEVLELSDSGGLLSDPLGISLIETVSGWYGVVTNFTGNNILLLDFGSSLYSDASISVLGTETSPTSVRVVQEGLGYYGLVMERNNGLNIYYFGDDLSTGIDSVEAFGQLGGDLLNTFSFDAEKEGTSWKMIALDISSELKRIDFEEGTCAFVNESSSTAFEPEDIRFSDSGEYLIELRTYHSGGSFDIYQDTVTVLNTSAPIITFTVGSQCISTPSDFTPSIPGLTSYSWDFNNDGIEDSSLENPTYDFSGLGAGTYTVRVDVIDGVCGNFFEEDIVIYADPPVPVVNASATLECTNTEITFTNSTDESAHLGVITYEWDFDGDGLVDSTEPNPAYTYTNPGDYTVSVVSLIPGCESSTVTIDMSIIDGPSISFSFGSNCFGEPIDFINGSSTEPGVTYLWDFGDGNSSTEFEPSHLYSTADTYTVSLTVSDGSCDSQITQDIEISDSPLASINASTGIENIPVDFSGVDLTSVEDAIVSWNWDFGGVATAVSSDTSVVFSTPGVYEIVLTVLTSSGCMDEIMEDLTVEASTVSEAFFSISEDFCMGEQVVMLNESINASSYEWDFCFESFSQSPAIIESNTPVSITGFTTGLELISDGGEWYGFYGDRTNGNFFLLEYGNSLSNVPTASSISLTGDSWTNYKDIRLVNESGVWYGLVTTYNNNKLYRLNFGSTIGTSATSEDLGNLSGWSEIRGMDLAKDGDDYVLAVSSASTNTITMVRFSGSITAAPEVLDLIDSGGLLSDPLGISLIETLSGWYGVVTNFTGNNILLLDFGSSLFSDASISVLGTETSPTSVRVVQEGLGYYGLVMERNNGLNIYYFGDDLSTGIDSVEAFGQLGGDLLNTFSFDAEKEGTSWKMIALDISSELKRIDFEEGTCAFVNESSSTAFEPEDIRFSDSGEYLIELRTYHSGGSFDIYQDTVTVLNTSAPIITFTVGSQCISTPIDFTSSTPSLTSYSWDFDNDGIEDSNLENPTYDFSGLGAGTYTVRVDVADGTCDNFYEEEITLYDPPPVPSYTVESTGLCLNTSINFANTTADASYTGPLEYSWEFIDDASASVVGTSSDKDANFAFTTPGNKTVRLTSSIPGCEEVTEQTITINPGPAPNFFASSVCQNESMTFTNTSTGGVSYVWDFGDGFTSTSENPSHVYTTAGNYFVTLTATDAEGCDASEVIEVAVSSLPEVNFDFEIPCTSAAGVTFIDLSTVDNADVIDWSWSVDGEELSTNQNPTLSFNQSGVKTVTLVVTGSNGCQASFTQDVEILPSPDPDFDVIIGCQGEYTALEDITSNEGNPVVSWLWDVNGTTYTTNDVSHVFDDPGIYEVTLEVTAQNFCSETVTKTIEVLQLPDVDFTIDGSCNNEIIYAEDLSTAFADQIVSRRWMLDNTSVGNGGSLFLENLPDNTYDLTLEVETTSGCITSATRSLVINQSPQAEMTFERLYGLPGDQLGFTNASSGGSAFQWLLDGELFSESSTDQNFIFETAGTYTVSLVAENDLGCADTTHQEVLIAVPEVDLRIGTFDLIQEGTVGKIFFEIENRSNLPVESIEALVELENQFTVTEEINQFIDIGETTLVGLNVGIPLEVAQASYFCVTLNSQYAGYDDLNPVDNEKCLTLEPQITVEDPFPNPVTDIFRLKVVVPEEGQVKISLINAAGKLEIENTLDSTQGLNNFFIDMSKLNPGIYFISVEVGGQTFQRKVIKR